MTFSDRKVNVRHGSHVFCPSQDSMKNFVLTCLGHV